MKVLIIEDNDHILNMYKIRLQKSGFEVITAKNGAWGLKILHESVPDIILLDIVMPAMDGYEFVTQVRKEEEGENRKVPIIFLSNSVQDSDIKKAKEYGANGYFVKTNITPSLIVKEINKILNDEDDFVVSM